VSAILYIKENMVSIYLCGQKLGSAWKILPITACSLVVSICGDKQGRAGQGGQGRHPPTGPVGGPQQHPIDLWPQMVV